MALAARWVCKLTWRRFSARVGAASPAWEAATGPKCTIAVVSGAHRQGCPRRTFLPPGLTQTSLPPWSCFSHCCFASDLRRAPGWEEAYVRGVQEGAVWMGGPEWEALRAARGGVPHATVSEM